MGHSVHSDLIETSCALRAQLNYNLPIWSSYFGWRVAATFQGNRSRCPGVVIYNILARRCELFCTSSRAPSARAASTTRGEIRLGKTVRCLPVLFANNIPGGFTLLLCIIHEHMRRGLIILSARFLWSETNINVEAK